MHDYRNRRRYPRIDQELPVQPREADWDGRDLTEDLDPEFDLLTQNISLGGCFIRTDSPEPPGTMVLVRIMLPRYDPPASVKAVGRVSWVRTGDRGPAGMGVQFVRVERSDLHQLREYIAGVLETMGEAA